MPSESIPVEVVEARLDELVDLRRRVLALEDPFIPEDGDEATFHLRARFREATVGALSASASPCPAVEATSALRFWGMAVEPSAQGHGIGRRLLRELEIIARCRGHDLLWANARSAVVGFYEVAGMQPIGPTERRANTGLDHRVVVRWLPKEHLGP